MVLVARFVSRVAMRGVIAGSSFACNITPLSQGCFALGSGAQSYGEKAMKSELIAAIGALALCVACGPQAARSPVDAAQSSCPDDGPRLPGTGLCQRTALLLLEHAEGAQSVEYPEGCSASVNETMLPGDQALIYSAARCGEVTTKLAFAGGAHSASISYEASAMGHGGDDVLIRLFGVDPDPQGALKEQIAALSPAERAICEIRPAGADGWPADALVIAPNAAARARMPKDEPISACGPLGLDEDSARYWRIRQGYAWLFDLGQEAAGFDPASVTVIVKGADGSWSARK